MVASGVLEDDWDFLLPRTIDDPTVKKPEDWDDNLEIDDPEDTKPEVVALLGRQVGAYGPRAKRTSGKSTTISQDFQQL